MFNHINLATSPPLLLILKRGCSKRSKVPQSELPMAIVMHPIFGQPQHSENLIFAMICVCVCVCVCVMCLPRNKNYSMNLVLTYAMTF